MNTDERLRRYHEFLKREEHEEAKQFFENNKHDERFKSLVELGENFIDGLEKRLKSK